MKNKASRKIYRRNGITHMCCKGGYFAMTTASGLYHTQLSAGDNVQATFTTDAVGHECVEIFLPKHKEKGIRETWYRVDVPHKARTAKDSDKQEAKLAECGVTFIAA